MSGAAEAGPGRRCLEALLAHDRAESRVRWLDVEGATDAEKAAAASAVVDAWTAYQAAALEWSKLATDKGRPSSWSPSEHVVSAPAPHPDGCPCYGCR